MSGWNGQFNARLQRIETEGERIDKILDGQDIEPATRLEYFLKKAAEGGGGGTSVHVVRATGNAVVENEETQTIVTMNSDADKDTIDGWLNAGEPVFCLAPRVYLNDDKTAATYEYHEVSMAMIKHIKAPVSMEPNSHAASLTYDAFDEVFTWNITIPQ